MYYECKLFSIFTGLLWCDKSPDECQKRWNFIMERVRHFRTLSELTDDALKWTDYRWHSFYGGVIKEILRNIN